MGGFNFLLYERLYCVCIATDPNLGGIVVRATLKVAKSFPSSLAAMFTKKAADSSNKKEFIIVIVL